MSIIRGIDVWADLEKMEDIANDVLTKVLEPYLKPVETCYECGVEVSTLKHNRRNTEDIRISALFLKRALTDLRVVWKLLFIRLHFPSRNNSYNCN